MHRLFVLFPAQARHLGRIQRGPGATSPDDVCVVCCNQVPTSGGAAEARARTADASDNLPVDWRIGIDLRAPPRAAHVIRQIRAAAEIAIAGHRGRAGKVRLRVHPGDAATLAADARVLGILGPFRSADTAAALTTVNEYGAPMISASNTYVPLTSRGPSFEHDEPDRYYAYGPRTYVRLFPSDFHQAAALVQVGMSLGVRRPFILHDDHPYGVAIYQAFSRAALAAGLKLGGVAAWHGDGLEQVVRASADALVLCGLFDGHAHQLIHEKVRRLGPNNEVKLLGADGFLSGEPLGTDAADMVALAPGVRPGYLPQPAEEFVEVLSTHLGIERDSVEPYALHAAEAVGLLLRGIDSVGFSRAALVQRLFDGNRHDGILGAYTVLPSGDIAAEDSPILGFSIYKASGAGTFVLEQAVVPSAFLVNAAFA
jgi:ABC-type branched-subunit amino acid transport system substrate-binding protein